jgi:hypothetical protein
MTASQTKAVCKALAFYGSNTRDDGGALARAALARIANPKRRAKPRKTAKARRR